MLKLVRVILSPSKGRQNTWHLGIRDSSILRWPNPLASGVSEEYVCAGNCAQKHNIYEHNYITQEQDYEHQRYVEPGVRDFVTVVLVGIVNDESVYYPSKQSSISRNKGKYVVGRPVIVEIVEHKYFY